MSEDRWNTVLVLGGIRSGKSAFAESLVADAPTVRYVATAVGGEDDPEWIERIEAHQRRRPQSWSTEETGPDPARLTDLLTEAKPDDTLLIDDLGGWVAALLDPARQPNDDVASVDALATAVRRCAARVVLVSPEVGLSLVPVTPVGRAFADAVGTANQALADACDGVVLVVAGQPTWLKPMPPTPHTTPATPDEPAAAATASPDAPPTTPPAAAPTKPAVAPPPTPKVQPAVLVAPTAPETAGPETAGPETAGPETAEPETAGPTEAPAEAGPARADAGELVPDGTDIRPGMDLPMPDGDAGPDARDRLGTLDLPGAGVGVLAEAIEFAAATQGTAIPRPWGPVRVMLFAGAHDGGAAAGTDRADVERRVAAVEAGRGPLMRLAGAADADVAVVRVPASGAMEDGPVLSDEAVDDLLRQGWELTDAAGSDGKQALVIGSVGVGTDAAATAVLAATTGAEPVAALPRVLTPGGMFDDNAWMLRCAAVRDALHRIRREPRGPKDILAQIGGADLTLAVGALLGAAARRMPVLLDGPVGVAAALVARDMAGPARHWCLLPDAGTQPLVAQGADVLGLIPVLNMRLDLGEGANALAALPLLRSAIGLARSLPVHPTLPVAEHDGSGTDTEHDGSGTEAASSTSDA
ncbi:bifunctional adenosylcobinamide kinase/adenosylcobinamide-phosphate guanylyltransferase [Mangrovihabitans endophyticus]|uniref:Adenosylcobinamide kinase n=1 Tax=Mangrovihabitans endophyticus TaxID=1751298 RepID=A0A8J3BZ94_9ACTN|nr:bifunctional adenosylcobinamide kinase/adenosylcobinamide-phosphate guanylyltransferase [Mangrovihabitans endophyticus]GGK87802.1 hypothetical protein GCM10012284_22330 [Mangrovihabitans endophyticus]